MDDWSVTDLLRAAGTAEIQSGNVSDAHVRIGQANSSRPPR
jgi:hypothetical protein